MDGLLRLVLLVGQFLNFLLVFILFPRDVPRAHTEAVLLILVQLLIELHLSMHVLLDFLLVAQVLRLIGLELVDQFSLFLGKVLHFLRF